MDKIYTKITLITTPRQFTKQIAFNYNLTSTATELIILQWESEFSNEEFNKKIKKVESYRAKLQV